jgi:hypothetical protein
LQQQQKANFAMETSLEFSRAEHEEEAPSGVEATTKCHTESNATDAAVEFIDNSNQFHSGRADGAGR